MIRINQIIGFGLAHTVAPDAPYMTATGGTITTDGDYKVHTFLSSGTFTPTVGTEATGNKINYLVVAGGGSGGGAGGGGAGGYKTATSQTVIDTGYVVTVGGGGAAKSGNGTGNNG